MGGKKPKAPQIVKGVVPPQGRRPRAPQRPPTRGIAPGPDSPLFDRFPAKGDPRGDRSEAENQKFDDMSKAKGFNKGGIVTGST